MSPTERMARLLAYAPIVNLEALKRDEYNQIARNWTLTTEEDKAAWIACVEAIMGVQLEDALAHRIASVVLDASTFPPPYADPESTLNTAIYRGASSLQSATPEMREAWLAYARRIVDGDFE
jgi:hypothetical protein